jgi:mono/diheme cytochrome c family protein
VERASLLYGTISETGRVPNCNRRRESRLIQRPAVPGDQSKKDCLKAEVRPYLSRHSNEPFLSSQFDMYRPICSIDKYPGKRNGTTMKRIFSILALQLFVAACALAQMPGMDHHPSKPSDDATTTTPSANTSNITFTKDIAPIVQQNCQGCHRPGEGTPFSLLTYEDARPWAKDMKRMVQQRAMPPWFEDGHTAKFANNRALTQAQIDTIVAWVNAGAPKGDPKDLPTPRQFLEGWTIPKPDVVFTLPKPFSVPDHGVLEYQYVILPTGFTEDKWVQFVEAAPSDRTVVHHIVAYVRRPGSNYFKDQPKNVFFEAPPSKADKKAPTDDVPNDWLVGYAPGQPPDIFEPGQAKLVPAGSDIVLEVHYMPEGKATTDQSSVGLVFAKEPPKERVMTLMAGNENFKIPPGDPNYQVDSSFTVRHEMTLLGVHPHMHTRGKDAQYRLVFPDGETRTILNVPHYNWHWQLWYNLAEPITLPVGTRIECTTHFDNSANNPENPDPTKTVIWGQQSFDEMMVCFFNVAFPAQLSAKDILPLPKPKAAADVAQKGQK